METWDDIAREWVDDGRDAWWRAQSDRVNGRLLEQWLPPGTGPVLKTDLFDEAVHEGLWPVLRTLSARPVGFDVSGRVVHAAQRRYPDMEAAVGDVRCLPFAAASFDTIVSLSTLDHFEVEADLVRALVEMRRVLRPGGRLILTMDNPVNPAIALRNALPYRVVHALGLVPYYVGVTAGPGRLRRLVGQAGFRVTDARAIVHCPRVLAVPVGRLLRQAAAGAKPAFLDALTAFERLAALPTRFLTGHFVALHCVAAPAAAAPSPEPSKTARSADRMPAVAASEA